MTSHSNKTNRHLLKSAAALVCASAFQIVATQAQPAVNHPVPDGRQGPFAGQPLGRAMKGREALASFAGRLPAIAAHYHQSVERLQELLASDDDLWTDTQGHLFYADSALPEPTEMAPLETTAVEEAPYPLDQTFQLHSRPTASRKIYLDFNGHRTVGTSWNSLKGISDIYTPPFDFDGNSASFSTAELERIQLIWRRVVEDYAPFEVDVTTEDPGAAALTRSSDTDLAYGIRVCIGGSASDWYGSGGGVAYLGSFHWASDTPCFVFPKNLGDGEKNIAEAVSHEVGHSVDLHHDGTSTETYYRGHGTGQTSWAPIMGVGYYANIVQFSKGEYAGANNREDDLAIITRPENIPYRADDHPNTRTLNPGAFDVSGIIGQGEVDSFLIDAGAGDWNLTLTVDNLSPNLYAGANLYLTGGTGGGQLIATLSNLSVTPNTFRVTGQPAGTYMIVVFGQGALDPVTTGFSSYASMGQYRLSGTSPTRTPAVPAQLTPGSANPDGSVAVSAPTIGLTWGAVAGADRYEVLTYNWDWATSTWVNAKTFAASGNSLTYSISVPDTHYAWAVRAGNAYGWSEHSGFVFFQHKTAACTFSISPGNASFSAMGGSGTVTVTSLGGCSWKASSPVSWIVLTSASTGTGTGAVTYKVLENTSKKARSAYLTIAGKSFLVSQARR